MGSLEQPRKEHKNIKKHFEVKLNENRARARFLRVTVDLLSFLERETFDLYPFMIIFLSPVLRLGRLYMSNMKTVSIARSKASVK